MTRVKENATRVKECPKIGKACPKNGKYLEQRNLGRGDNDKGRSGMSRKWTAADVCGRRGDV